MKKLMLIACILLSFSELFANKNDFNPGYIILESGDTITGQVKTKNWRINPIKVTFTSTLINNDTLTYELKDINGFSTNNFIFIKRRVKIDEQPDDVNELANSTMGTFNDEDTTMTYREETVLLQVLVRGNASLYRYVEPNGRSHYYLESSFAELQELLNTIFEKTIISNGGVPRNFAGYAQEYKTQLLTSLIGCNSITYNECDILFKESAFIKLLLKYNQCVIPNTQIYFYEEEKWILEPYFSVGLAFGSMKFKSAEVYYNYFGKADFTKSTSFTANVGLKYIIPKYDKRLSIYTDFAYNSYHFESQIDQQLTLWTYSLLIDYSQLGLNLGLSYDLSKKQTNPFVKGGVSILYSFNYTMEATAVNYDSSYDFWPAPRQVQFGFNLGAGINFANLAFEYQFLIASGFSSDPSLKNTPITNSILVKYTFAKKKSDN